MFKDLKEAIEKYKNFAECEAETVKILRQHGNEKDAKYFEEAAENDKNIVSWLTELQERREADKWISVEDRLPDKNGNYLVCLNNGGITTDIFDEEELFMGFWGYMTHWRPLPKSPESEGK